VMVVGVDFSWVDATGCDTQAVRIFVDLLAQPSEFRRQLRDPVSLLQPAEIDTYDDHRMAMSFAVAALRVPGIRLRDPGCVAKTFPGFFDVLDAITP